jgi:uncharacterized membrane protein YbaN (DUF454 family)
MTPKTLIGYGLLLLGIMGCLLPIIPGIPFLLGGAAILGWEHPLIRPWAKYLRRRQPVSGKPEGHQ